ncbi:hypothetical protein ACQ5SK_03100 [Bradyrhizobium japonicum]
MLSSIEDDCAGLMREVELGMTSIAKCKPDAPLARWRPSSEPQGCASFAHIDLHLDGTLRTWLHRARLRLRSVVDQMQYRPKMGDDLVDLVGRQVR